MNWIWFRWKRPKNNSQLNVVFNFHVAWSTQWIAIRLYQNIQTAFKAATVQPLTCLFDWGAEDVKVSSAADFTNSANTFEAGEMKVNGLTIHMIILNGIFYLFNWFTVLNGTKQIRIDITGAKTQAIYDNVFSKLVAAAQPIPGFRRGKGG